MSLIDGPELAKRMPGLFGDANGLKIVAGPDDIHATLLSSTGREVNSYASNAHLLGLVIRGATRHDQWHDNVHVCSGPLTVGMVNIVPAGTTPRAVGTGVAVLHFYLPHASLRERAACMGRRGGNRELEIISPLFASDHAIAALGRCFVEVIEARSQTDRLYRDSLLEALIARILQRWSNAGELAETTSGGGLARWQLKRVCEAMDARLDGDVDLRTLASTIDLSPSHFSRAFKQTTGLPPSRWLAMRRIEQCKALLQDRGLPLAEVALAAGFSAQPAFTTAFRRATGVSPGQWRRLKTD